MYEPTDDTDWLLYELGGKHRAQVLSTLAAIGLPDQLQQLGCASVARLAELIGSDPADLESLMRAATGMGCLLEEPPGSFRLTARGRKLCSDSFGTFAAYLGAKTQWDPWSRFRDGLRDGMCTTPFRRTFGQELYAHLQQDPAASAEYDRAIDAFTRYEVAQVMARLDFSDRRCLVDVGGGRGALLRELLESAPNARGILFDLPHVVHAAAAGLPANVQPVAGDFFESVPDGGDVYLVKHVVHNWSDEAAMQLLDNCRRAKSGGGIVVVIDALLSPGNRPDLARMLDLEMRVLCGGRERRKPEMRRLLRGAGLTLLRAEELTPLSWLFVAN